MPRTYYYLTIIIVLSFFAAQRIHGKTQAAPPNPHIPSELCKNCHIKIPTCQEAALGDFSLIGGSIDATCHICHPEKCCRGDIQHPSNHPSNVKTWDRKKVKRPLTVPLHSGYITCNTCHLHRFPGTPTIYLLRKVKTTKDGLDWTDLCRDCHVGY